MRSLLGFILFASTLIAILVFMAGPLVVRPLVVDVVRAALPAGTESIQVEVDVDGFDLLAGHVGGIRITGSNLAVGRSTVRSMDLTLRTVGVLGRDADAVAGSLDGVTVSPGGGPTIHFETVRVSGPSAALRAEAHMTPAAAEALVAAALAEAGLAVDRIVLVAGAAELDVMGRRLTVPLAVADGAIVVPAILGIDARPLVAPRAEDAWRITGLTVLPSGLDVEASLDLAGLPGQP